MRDDVNDVRITNDDPIDNTIRYTNDDIPNNEIGTEKENAGYSEFGTEVSLRAKAENDSVRFSSDYDIQKIASTFVVVSLVALSLTMDDSPFGEFFDPIMGAISESFGISDVDTDYEITCDLVLTPGSNSVSYAVSFDEEQDGTVRLLVHEGSTLVNDILLDTSLSGTVTNLTPGTAFVFTVTVNGTTVEKQSVSTTGTYDGSPLVTLLSAESNTAVSRNDDDTGGYFDFRLSVIDRRNVASDFHYSLAIVGGQTVCGATAFTGSVTDTQHVLVLDDLIPEATTEPVEAQLSITWTEGTEDKYITETVYL